jgi:L-seryl-tRNA(Ser) seleniumtransferase
MPNQAASQNTNLRALPSVDQLLRNDAVQALRRTVGLPRLTAIVREITEELRSEIQANGISNHTADSLLAEAVRRIQLHGKRDAAASMKHVINATGVILHTNLGRAPLSAAAREAIQAAAGYTTLEYDATVGARGRRGARAEELLIQLTGAEAALVVNNCAAAALLILTVVAGRGETIVSRGELVEIGGDFRVPDVMANSGTRMVEVGSTNRTRLDDYKRALTENTRLIMRVHPSNYRIVGFTDAPELLLLATLAHERGLFLYEDAGSGVLADLSAYGLTGEPIISESLKAGADVVSFSGDKLLGAGQAGLIVGKREIVDRLRKHSLYRALRADKLTLAALEATLEAHRRGAFDEIPALQMLAIPAAEIEQRALKFVEQLRAASSEFTAELIPGESAIGGGSGPTIHPATSLIALKHSRLSAAELESLLRTAPLPVIARIADDLVLIDLRTVTPNEETNIQEALRAINA